MKCDVLNPASRDNSFSRRSPSRRASINAMHRRRVEGAALETVTLFVEENFYEMAHDLIFDMVTLLQFNSRLSGIVQGLLQNFIPQRTMA